MAGSSSEESGVGRSLEGMSNGQQLSGEALAEWRSSEQVENGIASTSPPYWDTDDDDDCGPKPSELYGKYTWKIDKFSQINKRELRSNAFEVGGYKWYILIYPQGCDVCNHLSLFLCVANHDKLLPGWSHFAQFTIAVVNKDPKKSKYSDTLHRFWKKEHDWGWKKFMELSKVLDGFVDADTLKIKAQVQVIRERVDRPFRCLDCQYRRELVRVYLSNVEQICRRFVEERRGRLGKLIEDKVRWSSFCTFWLGIEQNARRRMSREKSDLILKVAVKHFFIEKEVTSTLVMDSLYSGLKALEGQTKNKAKGKGLDAEELPVPIVRVEKDTFILVDDVLLLLERAALEPLPPKDEKGPQNRTKDGGSGEDFSKDSIERDERRLTELGRRTIEIFVLAHIFSSKIEVAYQEAVALKRQEELIREEEEAWMTGIEQKAKRGASEKEKKSKKKQGKQKRNNRKLKDKGKDEKPDIVLEDKPQEQPKEFLIEDAEELLLEKSDISDVSDSVECVPETIVLQPDSDDRDLSPVNWDTDTSEVQPPTEAGSSGASCLTTVQNGGRKSPPSMMDDSSSTCSTDSVPSVVINRSYKGQKSQPEDPKLNLKKSPPKTVHQKTDLKKTTPSGKTLNTDKGNVLPVNTPHKSGAQKPTAKAVNGSGPGPGTLVTDKPVVQQVVGGSVEKPSAQPVPMVSRPLSAPLVPGSRPGATLPVVSTVHAAPFLPRSVSAAGRLGPDASPPQSYRNAMMGNPATSTSFSQTLNPSHSYSPPPMMTSAPMFVPESFERVEDSRRFSFGVAMNHHHHNDVRGNDPFLDQFSNEVPGGRMLTDEFPHLDIINDLLDDEVSPLFQSFSDGPHHLARQLTYPGGSVDQSSSTSSSSFERIHSFHDEFQHNYGGGPQQQPTLQAAYMNGGHMNGLIQNQWQMSSSDVLYPSSSFIRNMDDNDGLYDYHHHRHHHHHHHHPPDYSNNMMMGVNGYTVYHRPSNGQ